MSLRLLSRHLPSSSQSIASSSSSASSLLPLSSTSFKRSWGNRIDDIEPHNPPKRERPRSHIPIVLPNQVPKYRFGWGEVHKSVRDNELPPAQFGERLKRELPRPKAPIVDTKAFFDAIGRDIGKKLEKHDVSWKQLFTFKSDDWEELGLACKDRKYVAWCREKYRQGFDPRAIATIPKAPKTLKGAGPLIQNGIRVPWSSRYTLPHAKRPWGFPASTRVKKEK